MSFELRATAPDEYRAAADTFRGALLNTTSTDEEWAKQRLQDSWASSRSISAWDGDRCIGHVGALPFQTSVPGGARLPMAGVTRVGVLQTHRRRGVLTAAMHRLLREAAEQGQVLAGLRASEAVIYGRFGFAVAAEAYDVEIDLRRGNRVVAEVAPGTFRQLGRAETLATIVPLHERVGFDRVGTVDRPMWMHQFVLDDALEDGKATYVIVHTDPDGTDDGYTVFTLEWPHPFATHAGGNCEVSEMWGATPAVELALWQHVLSLDLVDTVRAEMRPADDPLRFALRNQREYTTRCRVDEQWLRLLDVDAALTARTYNASRNSITVAVTDPLLSGNDGIWRVTADGAERLSGSATAEAADLVTTINGLSAGYLGGTTWHELWVAGVVRQQRAGAVADADVLFASRPLPRCGTFY